MPDARLTAESNISMDKIDVHDHVALFFQTMEEKERCLSRLVRLAYQRDEACVFMTRKGEEMYVRSIISNAGLRPDCLSKDGRISIADPSEYLDGREGTASLMLDFFGEVIDSVLDKGFTAVRLFNDIDHLGEILPEHEIVMFESLSNELYDEKNAIGFCLVNVAVNKPNQMNAILTHPTLVIKGFTCNNHFFAPPEECSRHFGRPPNMQFILERLLEIQMSEVVPGTSDEDLRVLNVKLQSEVERRQMVEWALLRSENDYRTAMDAISDMVIVTDKENRVLIANDAFLECMDVIGHHGKVIGEDLNAMMPFLKNDTKNDLNDLFKTGRSSSNEGTFSVNGQELTFEIRKVPIKEGDEVGRILTIVRNITEYHKARNELIALKEDLATFVIKQADEIVALNERFAFEQERRQIAEGRLLSVLRVLESSKIAIFVGDRDRQIIYANPACCEYVGYGKGEIDKVDFMELFVPEERLMIEEIAKGLKDRNEIMFSARAKMRDGSHRPSAISMIKINDTEGITLGIMTDRIQLDQRLGPVGTT